MKTYGRTTIYANYTEKEIVKASEKKRRVMILDILKTAIPTHEKNKTDTQYLKDYYIGEQDICNKKKITRDDINNKTVENWAYALIDFKKCWQLGKPIQYVQVDNSSSEEVSWLNKYCGYENKQVKDLMIFEDMLVSGRGFRYTAPDEIGDEDEAPFEIVNVDNDSCEVVYSSQLGHEQLLSFIETSKEYLDTNDENGKKNFTEYTVYLRNKLYVVNDKGGNLNIVSSKNLYMNDHYIKEYYLNRDRISFIEIGKDLFNDINYLESLDKDDMEQFVNAIMVFINCEYDMKKLEELKQLGAVGVKSTSNMPADIKLLEQRLNANTTQTYYSRLLNALHQILGIPKANDSGDVSYGDTGQARLTGQGYTSSGIRADGTEVMFKMCDLNCIKTILKICKSKDSEIKNLKVIDIDAKFQRDMSDNLLVKTQALTNLQSAKIPRKYANAIIGLFSDPNAVTQEQEIIFGKEGQEQQVQQNPIPNDDKDKQTDKNMAMQLA